MSPYNLSQSHLTYLGIFHVLLQWKLMPGHVVRIYLNSLTNPILERSSFPPSCPSFFFIHSIDMSSAAEEDTQRVDSRRKKALVLEEMMQQASGTKNSSEGEVGSEHF